MKSGILEEISLCLKYSHKATLFNVESLPSWDTKPGLSIPKACITQAVDAVCYSNTISRDSSKEPGLGLAFNLCPTACCKQILDTYQKTARMMCTKKPENQPNVELFHIQSTDVMFYYVNIPSHAVCSNRLSMMSSSFHSSLIISHGVLLL